MTLAEEIDFWNGQAAEATLEAAALLAHGVATGLKIAKHNYACGVQKDAPFAWFWYDFASEKWDFVLRREDIPADAKSVCPVYR